MRERNNANYLHADNWNIWSSLFGVCCPLHSIYIWREGGWGGFVCAGKVADNQTTKWLDRRLHHQHQHQYQHQRLKLKHQQIQLVLLITLRTDNYQLSRHLVLIRIIGMMIDYFNLQDQPNFHHDHQWCHDPDIVNISKIIKIIKIVTIIKTTKMIKIVMIIKMVIVMMMMITFLPPQQSMVAGSGRPTGLNAVAISIPVFNISICI